ncbi:AAEL014126-PA [Aedes aegypti]|uniref:AAEL014126-PA n=1 Tax=Aedes aegypti TaxID=7159 RepID=Q16H78_AEDAE|nr:AAEL014126-PA [Aedes aegypti]
MNAMQISFLVIAVMAVGAFAVPFDFFQLSGFDESNNQQNFEDAPSSVDQSRDAPVEPERDIRIEFEPDQQEEVRRGAAIEEVLNRDDAAQNSAHEDSSSSAVMSISQRRIAVDSVH